MGFIASILWVKQGAAVGEEESSGKNQWPIQPKNGVPVPYKAIVWDDIPFL